MISIACSGLLLSSLKVVVSAKCPKCTYCHLEGKKHNTVSLYLSSLYCRGKYKYEYQWLLVSVTSINHSETDQMTSNRCCKTTFYKPLHHWGLLKWSQKINTKTHYDQIILILFFFLLFLFLFFTRFIGLKEKCFNISRKKKHRKLLSIEIQICKL